MQITAAMLKKERTWLLLGFLSVFFLLWTRLNYNAVEYGVWQSDEFHTVTQGVHNLLLKDSHVNFRAQEGVRWIVRGSYPYALYKLCQQMGSDPARHNWGYPGHHYVQNAFGTYDPVNKNEPNVKLFLHALGIPSLLLFFLSFLPLLYYCYRKNYRLLAFGVVIAIGLSDDVLSEQRFLYIEPVLMVAINLLIAFFLYVLETGAKKSWLVVLASFLAAWTVSVKLTGLFFAGLPLIAWACTLRKERPRLLATAVSFGLLFAAFYLLINVTMFIASPHALDDFIHDFFSNIWNYASAGRVGRGWPHFRLIFAQFVVLMGAGAYVFPALVGVGLWWGRQEERLLLGTLSALTFVSIHAIADTTMYMSRNVIPFYVPALVLLFLSLEIVFRTAVDRFPTLRGERPAAALFAALLLFPILTSLLAAPGPIQRLKSIYRRPKGEFLKTLAADIKNHPEAPVYAIGFPASALQGSSFAGRVRRMDNAPEAMDGNQYAAYVSSLNQEWAPGFTGYVAVNRIENNFQLTNCILPNMFAANDEWGDYFIFHDRLPSS